MAKTDQFDNLYSIDFQNKKQIITVTVVSIFADLIFSLLYRIISIKSTDYVKKWIRSKSLLLLNITALVSLNLFMSFCMVFSYVVLGWYHNNLWWKYCLLFNQEKTFFGPIRSLINKLSWYYPKITYEDRVQMDMNKFYEFEILYLNLLQYLCALLFLN